MELSKKRHRLQLPRFMIMGLVVISVFMVFGLALVQTGKAKNSEGLEPVSYLPIILKSDDGTPITHTIIDMGLINPDDDMIVANPLGIWEKHHWTLTAYKSEIVTVSVAAESVVDVTISILDMKGDLLVAQNETSAGEIEKITRFAINPNESYTIEVYDNFGRSGTYFLVVEGNQSSFVWSSRGFLNYGGTGAGYLPESHSEYYSHLWYFEGQLGETISITTTAESDKSMLISLYNDQLDVVEDQDGEEIMYVQEAVTDVVLPETGLYLIWLEELTFDAADYSVSLDGQ